MKFFSTAAFVSTIIALASAQQQPPVSITAPLTGTKYQAGSKAVISWTKPTVPKISQIVLAKGDANALQPIATIARDINAADGKYEWDVPYDCENGDQYALELGTSPDLAFTGHFSLEGCTGGGFASLTGGNPVAAGNSSSSASPSGAASSSGSSAPSANGASPAAAPASSSSGSSSGSNSANAAAANASANPASAAVRLSSNQAIAALGVVALTIAHAF